MLSTALASTMTAVICNFLSKSFDIGIAALLEMKRCEHVCDAIH
jgi:hypothetical protein